MCSHVSVVSELELSDVVSGSFLVTGEGCDVDLTLPFSVAVLLRVFQRNQRFDRECFSSSTVMTGFDRDSLLSVVNVVREVALLEGFLSELWDCQ